MYRVCIKEPFMNCEKIFPIQQRKVKDFIEHATEKNFVNKIIIFGSSVLDRCHVGSDVDIYCELSRDDKVVTKYMGFVFDLWTNYTVDEDLMNEINKKGVVVYER